MGEAPTIISPPLADVSALVDVLNEQSPSAQLLADPSSKGYLSHLSTLPLTELTQEPTSLQTQSHHLTSSLTSFTHTSYPTFISLHKTTTELASSIETLSSSLNQLLDKSLPALETTAEVWKGRTEAVLRERDKARVVLEQHEKIRDLLDIPVLIDTCVRNGYFGEALSLASHVSALIHKADENKDKSAPPTILTSVRSEVQHSITQMHLSLLATLYEPNRKLPALWKAVNFLRKMDAFGSGFATSASHKMSQSPRRDTFPVQKPSGPSSEEQLALAFLIGRESCLKTTLETTGRDIQRLVKQISAGEVDNASGGVDSSNPQIKANLRGKINELDEREKEDLARYLKKYIDAWREGVYDIVTQYATIFLERSSTHPETSTNTDDEDLLSRLHTLLRTYSTRALSTHLFAVLKPAFPLLTLPHLTSFITQLNYCSNAFTRLGLDFRCILTTIFSTAVLSIVQRDLETAANKWTERVEKARGTTTKNRTRTTSASSTRATVGPAELPSKWFVLPPLINSPPVPISPKHQTPGSSGPPHIPPQILASYPPLAELTNAVLGVLNGLRLVVPRSPSSMNISTNGITSDTNVTAEGVHQLLQMLDAIILTRGSTVLVDYFYLVTMSFTVDDGSDLEQQKVREREEKVVVASGRAFFDAFAVFIRRALVEGVYGVKLDVLEKGKVRARDAEGASQNEESWLGKRKEFQKIIKALGGEEGSEEESEEEEEEEEGQSGESDDDDGGEEEKDREGSGE